ncbi:MAG: hypothetical protein ABIK92_15355 [Pseudomonadota bacterium]
MKVFKLILTCALLLLICLPSKGFTASAYGKVKFVGTIQEANDNGIYSARFRFKLTDSTCTESSIPKTRWFTVKSGRMDGKFAHNAVNTKNAYQTLLTAFLTDANIQIDRISTCSNDKTIEIDLWNSAIGIY